MCLGAEAEFQKLARATLQAPDHAAMAVVVIALYQARNKIFHSVEFREKKQIFKSGVRRKYSRYCTVVFITAVKHAWPEVTDSINGRLGRKR